MLDLLVKNGIVVDGTGAPRRWADIGVKDGRIAAVGEIAETAKQTIDAGGRIVAPGFVDVHTHYDAQVFWDHSLSPSSYHGVTTVVGGNCGFSIAPLSGKAEDSEYLLHMLARVEGMPVESLQQGVPWDWTSFGSYLDKLEGRLGINAAFMVGHSAVRRAVMGKRAVGEKATEAEIAAMQELLRASIRAGGLGLSSSISTTHNDSDGNPVPSRFATDEELSPAGDQCLRRCADGADGEAVGGGQAAAELEPDRAQRVQPRHAEASALRRGCCRQAGRSRRRAGHRGPHHHPAKLRQHVRARRLSRLGRDRPDADPRADEGAARPGRA
jgi:hypothetical protein